VEIRLRSLVPDERRFNSLRHLFDPLANEKGLLFALEVYRWHLRDRNRTRSGWKQVRENLLAKIAIKFTRILGSVTLEPLGFAT